MIVARYFSGQNQTSTASQKQPVEERSCSGPQRNICHRSFATMAICPCRSVGPWSWKKEIMPLLAPMASCASTAFVLFWRAKVPDEPATERPLLRLDRLAFVLPCLYWIVPWAREASAQERQAHADSACIREIDVLDIFRIAEPAPEFFQGDAVSIREMHPHHGERGLHFAPRERLAGHGHF